MTIFLVFCQFICILSCPLDAVHLMVENFRCVPLLFFQTDKNQCQLYRKALLSPLFLAEM